MYHDLTVIDVHGHISTPPEFDAFGFNLLVGSPSAARGVLRLSTEALERSQAAHLRLLDERGIDVQFVSPRPLSMLHWEPPVIVDKWTRTTNDVIHQICRLHPDRFVGIGQLPQQSDVDTGNCIPELERCIQELGFVGAIITPDPAGARTTPPLDHDYWFPLYERAQQLGATLIVHGSNPRADRRIAYGYYGTVDPQAGRQFNFMMEQTLATQTLEGGAVFRRFPELRVVVVHCGGAPSRFAAPLLSGADQTPPDNLYFDTCAYDRWFLTAALRQRSPKRMLFGTECPGAGTPLTNPETGKPSDDLVPLIDRLEFLTDADKRAVFHENAGQAFPLLQHT